MADYLSKTIDDEITVSYTFSDTITGETLTIYNSSEEDVSSDLIITAIDVDDDIISSFAVVGNFTEYETYSLVFAATVNGLTETGIKTLFVGKGYGETHNQILNVRRLLSLTDNSFDDVIYSNLFSAEAEIKRLINFDEDTDTFTEPCKRGMEKIAAIDYQLKEPFKTETIGNYSYTRTNFETERVNVLIEIKKNWRRWSI